MPLDQLESVESNLRKLSKRLPQLPVAESLILRSTMILGRDATVLLDRLLKPAGLAESEFRLLMSLLAHDRKACAGDLCAALGQSPANLTRIADALVERGYVSRDTDVADRRRMLLTLLPEGERLLHQTLPEVSGEVTALFAGFTAAEKQQMLKFARRLLASIDALERREAQGDPGR